MDAPRLVILAPLPKLDAVPEPLDGRLLEDDVALLGRVLGGGQIVDQAPGEDVDQLDLGIADHESPRTTDRDCHLHRQLHRCAARRDHGARPLDGLLHGDGRGARQGPVIAVDPTGDRVAGEVDDVAVELVELGDDGMEDPSDVDSQFLCAALRSQFPGQRLGQWREPADVGKEGRSRDAIRQLHPDRQRAAAIPGNVGLRVVGLGHRPERRDVGFLVRHPAPAATRTGRAGRRFRPLCRVPEGRADLGWAQLTPVLGWLTPVLGWLTPVPGFV